MLFDQAHPQDVTKPRESALTVRVGPCVRAMQLSLFTGFIVAMATMLSLKTFGPPFAAALVASPMRSVAVGLVTFVVVSALLWRRWGVVVDAFGVTSLRPWGARRIPWPCISSFGFVVETDPEYEQNQVLAIFQQSPPWSPIRLRTAKWVNESSRRPWTWFGRHAERELAAVLAAFSAYGLSGFGPIDHAAGLPGEIPFVRTIWTRAGRDPDALSRDAGQYPQEPPHPLDASADRISDIPFVERLVARLPERNLMLMWVYAVLAMLFLIVLPLLDAQLSRTARRHRGNIEAKSRARVEALAEARRTRPINYALVSSAARPRESMSDGRQTAEFLALSMRNGWTQLAEETWADYQTPDCDPGDDHIEALARAMTKGAVSEPVEVAGGFCVIIRNE